ncbi:hypothetical protein BC628DRAFT_259377 [Trametes gibbosa]|nr:hypothetical protein BC628DRAFT_259377 [Trametes gibbosa]
MASFFYMSGTRGEHSGGHCSAPSARIDSTDLNGNALWRFLHIYPSVRSPTGRHAPPPEKGTPSAVISAHPFVRSPTSSARAEQCRLGRLHINSKCRRPYALGMHLVVQHAALELFYVDSQCSRSLRSTISCRDSIGIYATAAIPGESSTPTTPPAAAWNGLARAEVLVLRLSGIRTQLYL